ncbi:type II secretion system F family protein [Cellulomonas shaoxiangyii]|uniref:type II secretion system F family protein n=1 Tax=Cellulomonas shaoxiangyii TaxID=2566013 RepID=UPI001FC9AEC7|nr:type II secretion system F family protein [Cellulomonas shaoxiangyii]
MPPASVLLAAVRPGRRGRDDGVTGRVHAVVTGARTAAELGAPLAAVLEDLAAATAADVEHAGEVTAALAGPRATARVLVALPALGLLVGTALGARPWEVLASGGVGTAAAVLGALLVAAGRAWVGALLRRARAAGGTS